MKNAREKAKEKEGRVQRESGNTGGSGFDFVFILAGGSGTRLWPASTRKKPKQFLTFGGEKSLLRMTLERAFACRPVLGVVIITIAGQLEATLKECAGLPREERARLTIIPEPAARNTAPAIALGVVCTTGQPGESAAPGAPILVLPADHLITPMDRFLSDAYRAAELARAGYLVTFGVPPERPETGYGYLEEGSPLGKGLPGAGVKSFREKPDLKTAGEFLSRGGFYWNSGMFCFTGEAYMAALSEHSPDMFRVFKDFPGSSGERKEGEITIAGESREIAALYTRSPKDSIDYAVMEKSSSVAMIKASFSWSDIGSWDEAAKQFGGKGEASLPLVQADSGNNFIDSDLPVALAGVEDLVVVVKNGVVLVCKRGESQKIKDIVLKLTDSGREELL